MSGCMSGGWDHYRARCEGGLKGVVPPTGFDLSCELSSFLVVKNWYSGSIYPESWRFWTKAGNKKYPQLCIA